MWPDDCTQCMDPSCPTKEQWTAQWSLIDELYYERKWTLKQLGQFMCEQQNLHAKPRQYKSRFRSAARSSKRLRSPQYEAMAAVLAARNRSIHFEALRGGCRVVVTPQQIYKEIGRSRKRDCGNPCSPNRVLSLHDALELLEITGIDIIEESNGQSFSPRFPPAETPSSADDNDMVMAIPLSISTGSCPELPLGRVILGGREDEQYICRHRLSLAGMRVPLYQSSPQEQYDPYGTSFLYVPIDSSVDSMPSNSSELEAQLQLSKSLPRPQAPRDDFSRMAGGWVEPFVVDAFPANTLAHIDLEARKCDGLKKLSLMLRAAPETNKYLLPYLNSVVTVLSSYCKWRQLHEFLSRSCEVIDSLPAPTTQIVCPFKYALAHCQGDKDAVRWLGAAFPQTHQYLLESCGPDHPNVIVNSYYWAWHLLEEGQYHSVITMLQEVLPKALETFQNYNLIIVHCLAILARAYAELNEHQHARDLFQDALQRLERQKHTLPYRSEILVRLALTDAQLGNWDSAKVNLRTVINSRVAVFGYRSELTWGGIATYCQILERSGSAPEAEEVRRYHNQAYEREVERQWYNDKNYEIPAALRDVPKQFKESGSIFEVSDTSAHSRLARL